MLDVRLLDAIEGDPQARVAWLENAVGGTGLPTLIDELTVLGTARLDLRDATSAAARGWLGSDAAPVLEHGLARLSPGRLAELLRRPGLLVGLQELVATDGGAHWNEVARRNPDLDALAMRLRDGLASRLGLEAGTPLHAVGVAGGSRGASWPVRRAWLAMLPLAAAAAVLVAFVPVRRALDGLADARVVSGAASDPTGIVKAVVADDEGDWPAHPWTSGAAARAPAPDALVAESRDWSEQLRAPTSLSALQVSAAAERARDAIVAMAALAENGRLPLSDQDTARLEAACRRAVDDIDRLRSGIVPDDADAAARIREARASIVSTLGRIESLLLAPAAESGEPADRPGAGPTP